MLNTLLRRAALAALPALLAFTLLPLPHAAQARVLAQGADVCDTESPMPRTEIAGKDRQYDAPPPMVIDAANLYIACFYTEVGSFAVELFASDAPITVNNFVFLANDGYYDDIIFHRVVRDPDPFVVQGGDPTGTGRGGPGYQFDDEPGALALPHDSAGVLSMANAGPDTNGSQFFITLAPTPWLDGAHAVFGRVLDDGMAVVNQIEQDDVIETITIIELVGLGGGSSGAGEVDLLAQVLAWIESQR